MSETEIETPETDLAIEMAAEVNPFRSMVSVEFARQLERRCAALEALAYEAILRGGSNESRRNYVSRRIQEIKEETT